MSAQEFPLTQTLLPPCVKFVQHQSQFCMRRGNRGALSSLLALETILNTRSANVTRSGDINQCSAPSCQCRRSMCCAWCLFPLSHKEESSFICHTRIVMPPVGTVAGCALTLWGCDRVSNCPSFWRTGMRGKTVCGCCWWCCFSRKKACCLFSFIKTSHRKIKKSGNQAASKTWNWGHIVWSSLLFPRWQSICCGARWMAVQRCCFMLAGQ